MTNQWLTENRYRQYPLQVAATSAIPDAVLLDARFWLSPSIASTPIVALVELTTDVVTFQVVGTSITFAGVITSAADGQRIQLVLLNAGVPDVGLGAGWVVIGDVTSATAFSGSVPVSEVCVRVLRYWATTYAVQNRAIAQNIVRSQSIHPADDVIVDELDPMTVIECLQYADPADDLPDNAENQIVGTDGDPNFGLFIPIPHDPQNVVQYERGIRTYATASVSVADTIPPPTNGPVEVLGQTLRLTNGYNLALHLEGSELRIETRLGAGEGYNLAGEIDGFVVPYDYAAVCLKELAGATPDESGTISIRAGTGVSVIDSPGTHTVYIVLDLR